MRTMENLGDVRGKRVLVRCDFNVPLKDGIIIDDGRIRAALPTLKELHQLGAKIVILAHLGRPKGTVVPELSLAPVARRLSELMGCPVALAKDTYGSDAQRLVSDMQDGDVIVLENVRFNPEETSKNETVRSDYAAKIARLGDLFVSDGFGVVHRAQGSDYDIAKLLPNAAGLLIQKEVANLSRVADNPDRPFTVVLGGAKVSDKLGVIRNLLGKADRLLIGGGMSYTFLKAKGYEVGTSLLEPDMVDAVASYMQTAQEQGVELLLPVDVVVADRFAPDADALTVPVDAIPANRMGMDIGPRTRELFTNSIRGSKTVFWNGPTGVFEFPRFSQGTKAIADAVAQATKDGAFTIIGGGDSASAVRSLGFADTEFSHISTGGGASLEFLEDKPLPGLSVLE
ncbi:MAG: phosphoglycerate kinase [Aeriscardovia sp.]|nr:phosphoglycerate kinase [Aeriscardovia sp.]